MQGGRLLSEDETRGRASANSCCLASHALLLAAAGLCTHAASECLTRTWSHSLHTCRPDLKEKKSAVAV